MTARPRVAEFFAGIGLVRKAFEAEGFEIVWANDIEPTKFEVYRSNFGAADFRLGDVRDVRGDDVPDCEVATASFPCTDLSLAGNRAGLSGEQSSMFWAFARVLEEMGTRRPPFVLLENVPGFATSHGGRDLYEAIQALNSLGYACDLFVVDARTFVPQSRVRMFIVGSQTRSSSATDWQPSELRPEWVQRFRREHPDLDLQAEPLALPAATRTPLQEVVERLSGNDERWWDEGRLSRFVGSLSPLQASRLESMRNAKKLQWRTAYRRTRGGVAVWEIRNDAIAGCLRTARGGSSKQALVEAGRGAVRVRWMTAVEYAGLQGARDLDLSAVRERQALFGLGDAVCVPVIAWIARTYLRPALRNAPLANAG